MIGGRRVPRAAPANVTRPKSAGDKAAPFFAWTKPEGEMRLFLADSVHAVHLRDDLVFLDTRADAYFCLSGVLDIMAVSPHGEVDIAHAETAEQLLEAGLLSDRSPRDRQPPPPYPTTSSRLTCAYGPPPFGACAAALSATWSAARAFRRHSFEDLLQDAPSAAASARGPSAPLVQAVAQFEALRAWLPLQGECLMRSFHCRAFLRARGFDALWVFGVRTWPFSAHCWLQVGRTALDDDLERLTAYTPIMAV